jgi:hypothetical protein
MEFSAVKELAAVKDVRSKSLIAEAKKSLFSVFKDITRLHISLLYNDSHTRIRSSHPLLASESSNYLFVLHAAILKR